MKVVVQCTYIITHYTSVIKVGWCAWGLYVYTCIVYVATSLWKFFLIFVSNRLIEFLFNTHDFYFHKLNRTAHHSNNFCCIQYPLIYQQNSQFGIVVLFIIGRYWNYMLLAKTY